MDTHHTTATATTATGTEHTDNQNPNGIDCRHETGTHGRVTITATPASQRAASPSPADIKPSVPPRTASNFTSPNPTQRGLIRCNTANGSAVTAAPISELTGVASSTSTTAARANATSEPHITFGIRRNLASAQPTTPALHPNAATTARENDDDANPTAPASSGVANATHRTQPGNPSRVRSSPATPCSVATADTSAPRTRTSHNSLHLRDSQGLRGERVQRRRL